MRKQRRSIALLLTGAALMQFGGCGSILQDVALNAVTEFIWDSDVAFDFFGDDGPGLITG